MNVLAALIVILKECRQIFLKCSSLQIFLQRPSFDVECQGVSTHVEDDMRDLPNHAKIQGIITACNHSRVREASCRSTRARAPEQHERGSPSLLNPTWTTLACGDSTRPSCLALPSSVVSGKHVLGSAVPTARNLWLVHPFDLAAWYACCGVVQCRHHFDAFLKRFGKSQPQ